MAGTTTHTHDYKGVPIDNAAPGITDPTYDWLGRENEADKDYLGRDLQTPA